MRKYVTIELRENITELDITPIKVSYRIEHSINTVTGIFTELGSGALIHRYPITSGRRRSSVPTSLLYRSFYLSRYDVISLYQLGNISLHLTTEISRDLGCSQIFMADYIVD